MTNSDRKLLLAIADFLLFQRDRTAGPNLFAARHRVAIELQQVPDLCDICLHSLDAHHDIGCSFCECVQFHIYTPAGNREKQIERARLQESGKAKSK